MKIDKLISISSIVLLTLASLSISVNVWLGFASDNYESFFLFASAIGIELAKTSSISYSYRMIRDRDIRALFAVLVAVMSVTVSVTTIACFFDNKFTDKKLSVIKIQAEKDKQKEELLNDNADRDMQIKILNNKIRIKKSEVDEISNTKAGFDNLNMLSHGYKYKPAMDKLNNEILSINDEIYRLVQERSRTGLDCGPNSVQKPGINCQSQAGPYQSRARSIRLPALLEGNNYMFFGLGFFIDFSLAFMIIISCKNKRELPVLQTEPSQTEEKPVHKSPLQTITADKKTTPNNIAKKRLTKDEKVAKFIIGLAVGEDISISKVRKKFNCGHAKVAPIFENMISSGHLIKKNNKFYRSKAVMLKIK